MQTVAATSIDEKHLEAVPDQIRLWMNDNLLRVQDVMLQMDDGGSGWIDRIEFSKAMAEMGFEAPPSVVDALFNTFDEDGSKRVDYHELHHLLVRSYQSAPHIPPLPLRQKCIQAKRVRKTDANILQGVDLSDSSTVPDQIRERMQAECVRVVDVFKQFDDDASGYIDRTEFANAIREMGCEASDAELKSLFETFDLDNNKVIEYREMHTLLAHSFASQPSAKKQTSRRTRQPLSAYEQAAFPYHQQRAATQEAALSHLPPPTPPLEWQPSPLPPLPWSVFPPPPPPPLPPQLSGALQPPQHLPPPPSLSESALDRFSHASNQHEFELDWMPPPAADTLLPRKLDARAPQRRVASLPQLKNTNHQESDFYHATAIRPAKFDEAAALEQDARQRLARARRDLQRSASSTAVEHVRMRNKAKVEAVRADLDDLLGKGLTRKIANVNPASDDEVVALSEAFNLLLNAANPSSQDASWFVLYKAMDTNQSGHISYPELQHAVRSVLGYQGPETKLYSLWKALDANSSGFVTEGEFGRFWRLGRAAAIKARAEALSGLQRERKEHAKAKFARDEKRLQARRIEKAAQAAELMAQKAAAIEVNALKYKNC